MVRKRLIPLELLLLRASAAALPRLQQCANAALDILSWLVPRDGPRDWRQNTNSLTMLPLRAASYLRRPLAFRLQSLIEAVKAQQSGTYFSQWSESNSVALDATALQWTIFEVSDSDSVAVGLQALGALPLHSALARMLRQELRLRTFTGDTALTRTAGVHNAAEVLRVVRSLLCMQSEKYFSSIFLWIDIDSLHNNVLSNAEYPDAALVHAVVNGRLSHIIENASAWRAASYSLTSTAVFLMQTKRITMQLGDDSASWTICFLLCFDFEQLLDADWLAVIRDLSLVLSLSNSTDGLHFCLRSKEISVAELVASNFIRHISGSDSQRRAELTKASANIMGRLLLQIPDTDHGLITRCPSLLKCLAAGHFFSEDIEVRRIARRLHSIGEGFCAKRNIMPKQLWYAGAHVVHKSPPTKPDDDSRGSIVLLCTTALYAALEASLQFQDTRLSEALDLILYPLNIPDIDMSLWEMLSIDFGERADGDQWRHLAEALSTALCALDHGNGDHSGHLDAYFKGCNSVDFLKDASKYWLVDKRAFGDVWDFSPWLRVVQHNDELRPGWRKKILDSKLGNDAYTEMLKVLNEEFRHAPECKSVRCRLHNPRIREQRLVEPGSS